MKKYQTKSIIMRATHTGNEGDKFKVISEEWNDHKKLNGFERAIMLEITSNSDDFNVNKTVIRKRLGFYESDFKKAWKSLESKGYIFSFKNGMVWEYVIREIPLKNGSMKQSINSCDMALSDHHTQDHPREGHKPILKKITNINSNQALSLETLDLKAPLKTDSIISPVGDPLSDQNTLIPELNYDNVLSNIDSDMTLLDIDIESLTEI
jgi:hypothetical protein